MGFRRRSPILQLCSQRSKITKITFLTSYFVFCNFVHHTELDSCPQTYNISRFRPTLVGQETSENCCVVLEGEEWGDQDIAARGVAFISSQIMEDCGLVMHPWSLLMMCSRFKATHIARDWLLYLGLYRLIQWRIIINKLHPTSPFLAV